ncbi:hypothetical protein DEIPH_ctg017orf0222 [Deinococcus phoenicis]|uniref:Exonuclease domain-containing protein n=1 Tax=Deinococcus phoenicis TaxID=1476583 RepID=A0A016QSR3_9DEIO|nr:hypothetical protein [Deinococcus phoenicis]EYB68844.1 hypothetical protein DEIPH_ctg017orf0222 [Deinococcus phoenicis]
MPQPTEEQVHTAMTAAIRQFRAWADDPRVLVLDTETTGLQGGVFELAAVRVGEVWPLLAFLCAPGTDWTPAAITMHGHRLEEIKGAPQAMLMRRALEATLQTVPLDSAVLTYNAEFDRTALLRTWPGLRLPAFACIMTAYAPLAGQWSETHGAWKYVGLTRALELEQVDTRGLPGEHTAYGDAVRAALLIQAVAQRLTPNEEEAREVAEQEAQADALLDEDLDRMDAHNAGWDRALRGREYDLLADDGEVD